MKKFMTYAFVATFALISSFAIGQTREEKAAAAVNRGVEYLRGVQAEDGSFASQMGTGITSVALIGLLQNGYTAEDPMVAKALEYLASFAQPDGAIVNPRMGFGNYETSVAIVALALANTDGRYDKILQRAEKYIRKYQWDESEGISASDTKYGGAGYGGRMSRPDLSNTGFMLDALHSLGAGKDDPAIQKSLVFVSRCQNLESQYNTLPFASESNDGGFVYVVEGQGAAPKADGKEPLKSYGSMTYAGFKSMIYAGLDEDDPRMKAAMEWLSRNYTVEENPGQGLAGLYYYYTVMTKALKVYGSQTFPGADGQQHNWREEIVDRLISTQQEDGSWVNESPRWQENNPILVTGYTLMVFGSCKE